MNKNLTLDNQEATILKPQKSRPFFGRIWGYTVFFLLLFNFFYFFGYDPKSPYALSRSLWYADFRYWSDWIAVCCWFIAFWVFVSTVFSILVPKNDGRIFLFRRSFYQKLIFICSAISIWAIWYNYATLSLAVIYEPITNYIHVNWTLPIAKYITKYERYMPILLPAIGIAVLIIALIAWRIRAYFKRRKQSNSNIIHLILLALLPALLGADANTPPQKVATSTGIYDVKSKDDLLKFTTKEIRELVKMEDDRTRGMGQTPHPILVYCFEERSFKYTGGKYENAEIKYRLRIPTKIVKGKKYPLVVHLHGVGEAGTDNTMSLAHLHSILPLMVGEEQQDFFLMVLQCPPNNRVWTFESTRDGNLDVVIAATDHVIENNPIDENRLSLFGLSSGGYGVWQWLLKSPDKFTAAVPTSCGSPNDFKRLVNLKQTAIWTFRNKNDGNAPVESICEAMRIINSSGGFMELTQLDQGGHAAWRSAMDEFNCFGWMIVQKRDGWFNPPPEREVYTYRSASNCFFAFFLPLLLAAGMLIFQGTPYCERLHKLVVEKIFTRRPVEDKNDDTKDNFYTWTDITGKQELELKLIDVQDNNARFEMLDGKITTISVAQFCLEDQEILKRYDSQPINDGFRFWTNSTRTKKIELKLLGIQGGKIKFVSRNDKIFSMNINDFCLEDQELLKKQIPQPVDDGFRQQILIKN
jgi:predicted esterase